MRTVLPPAKLSLFSAEIATMMGIVFKEAWKAIAATSGVTCNPGRAEKMREALAFAIIDMVRDGERDVNRLQDAAVAQVLQRFPSDTASSLRSVSEEARYATGR
jgi:hypothetical protein